MIEIGARPLTLAEVAAVAREGASVGLAPGAHGRMAASRAVVERTLGGTRAVYGVNTGFGVLKDRVISADQVRQLQINLLRSHAAGVGRFAQPEIARAMLVLRAASLAHGHSGCRPAHPIRKTLAIDLRLLSRFGVAMPGQFIEGTSGNDSLARATADITII